MSALRTLLACLLLAALPLQGFAAATTLLCGPAHPGGADSTVAVQGHGHRAVVDGGDARHGHASAAPASADSDASPAWSDSGSGCKLRTAACHGLPGLSGQPAQVGSGEASPVLLGEPFQGFESQPAQVPEKPPRA